MHIPHKYADVIKAWADGKPVQFRLIPKYSGYIEGPWTIWSGTSTPTFGREDWEWRIKPEKKTGWIFIKTNHSEVRTERNSVHYPNQFIYETHEKAMKSMQVQGDLQTIDLIACIKIEYEEGQGL